MTRVLLVDDDLSFRRSLMIQLELEGFDVTEAESGKDALSKLSLSQNSCEFPDVVVTDMRMPEMDGPVLIKRIQAEYPVVPIVVMSAFEPPEEMDEKCFLHKPFKIVEMMDTMANVIRKH